MFKFIRFRTIVLLAVTLFTLSACATAPPVKRRVFWPPLPDTPKIEWIGTYRSANDLSETETFLETIIGKDDAVSITKPLSIASNGTGKVYVSNPESADVHIFDFTAKTAYKLALNPISHLTGISLDGQGNIYVADSAYKKIHVVSPDNKPVKVLDFSDKMESIGMFAVDKINEHLIIPDLRKHKIIVTDLEGKFLFEFGKRGDGDGEFNLPLSIAVEYDGGIVVCDSLNSRIQRFTSKGVFVNKFGRRGDGPGDLSIIKGVAVDSEGHIYVTDGKESKVTIFSPTGEYLLMFGGKYSQQDDVTVSAGGFLIPQGIYIDKTDRIYVADQLNNRFQAFQYMNAKYIAKHPPNALKPRLIKDKPKAPKPK